MEATITEPIKLDETETYLMSLAKHHITAERMDLLSFREILMLIYEITYGVYAEDQDEETIFKLMSKQANDLLLKCLKCDPYYKLESVIYEERYSFQYFHKPLRPFNKKVNPDSFYESLFWCQLSAISGLKIGHKVDGEWIKLIDFKPVSQIKKLPRA